MGELAEEQAQLEKLPVWVPDYLAAWGSKFDPEGKRMRVKTAATLAGTTESNVRELRRRSERFQLMEKIAREGGSLFLSSYMEAGLRTMAPSLLQAFRTLVANLNPQVVLQGMKWAMDRPEALTVDVTGVVATDDVSELSDEALDTRLDQLLVAARKARAAAAADGEEPAAGEDGDQPLHRGGAEGRDGPPDDPGPGP